MVCWTTSSTRHAPIRRSTVATSVPWSRSWLAWSTVQRLDFFHDSTATPHSRCPPASARYYTRWHEKLGHWGVRTPQKIGRTTPTFYVAADCSARNWVYHPYFVMYNNLYQGIGPPQLWKRGCAPGEIKKAPPYPFCNFAKCWTLVNQNAFASSRSSGKFAMKVPVEVPPHLSYVATLPCEMFGWRVFD